MNTASRILFASAAALLPLIAQQQRNFPQPPPPKDVTVTEIPGVIAAGAKWTIAYQSAENSDGITASPDGGLLFAQEQSSHINKLDGRDQFSTYLTNGHGVGGVAVGPRKKIYAVERTCTDPGQKPDECKENTAISTLTPMRKILADNYAGKNLGRINDLVVDKKGGVYFSSGTPYYVSPSGQVLSFGAGLRTNGIQLSRDEKTLYVTNGPVIMAFDVQPDGSVTNQREFGKLEGGGNGDGMAIDSEGRVYCATAPGVQVLGPDGKYLGLIPMPRNGISIAFAGKDKKTLYAVGNGAVDKDGKEIVTPQGVRNTAMTIYKIPMVAQGFKGRTK
ncbi:MAG: SMP-30/gluconolactonase/LRE family protein [Bryobacteraceae bacterium]